MTEQTIGERLKVLRVSYGLTASEFSDRIGYNERTARVIESGSRAPTQRYLFSVINHFHVNPEWLMNGNGEMINSSTQKETMHMIIDAWIEALQNLKYKM